MTSKTVLITGANKSIGYETARQLGELGYRIWLGSRDGARGEAAAGQLAAEGHDVRMLAIDVTSDDSVRAAAARVQEEGGSLDVLINNAGVFRAPPMTPSQEPLSAIRDVYETNVFGPIRVTQAFLPLLKAAGDANIVMVSSALGSLGWLSDPSNQFYGVNVLGYSSFKSALNAVTVSFAKELAAAGIRGQRRRSGLHCDRFKRSFRIPDRGAGCRGDRMARELRRLRPDGRLLLRTGSRAVVTGSGAGWRAGTIIGRLTTEGRSVPVGR